MPARRARRRARGDVLPARRAREPGGRRAGLRAGARAHGALRDHRLRGDRDRARRRRRAGGRDDASARSRRRRSSAPPASGRPRSRGPSGSSCPSSPYLREVGFTGARARPPDRHPADGRLLDRLLLPPRRPGAAVRDGRPEPAARLRRADRPRLARARHGGRRAALPGAPRHGHRRRLEGLLRGHARPQRARRRGARLGGSSTRPASPAMASCRRRPSARSCATSCSGREAFVDVAPLSAERFARAESRPERNVI